MNYLNHATLKAFLCLLYGQNSILLINFKYQERQNLVDDIFLNKLEYLFVFKNSKAVIENSTIDDVSDCLYDISADIKTLETVLPKANKEKLLKFINNYINEFKRNNLISLNNNYYPFEKSYKISINILEKYKEYGKKIIIKIPLNDKSRTAFYSNEARFIDVLFYLILSRYIKINIINIERTLFEIESDYFEDEFFLIITLTFVKTYEEISDLEETWLSYGDIRLNTIEHIALYKNNFYRFKSADTKSFKLLKMLIESHGKRILISDAYFELNPSDKYKSEYFELKKEVIINLIKDLKRKLKMSQDKDVTIRISIAGKEIFLNSNTP